MKLYIPLLALVSSALALTSCSKNYDCNCYSPGLNRNAPVYQIKGTKKEARNQCKELPYSGMYTGTDYVCNLD